MTNKKEESVFSGNQVMVMLEQMSDGIAVIAEEQKELKKGQEEFKKEISEQVGCLREEFKKEISEQVGGLRQEMNEKFDQVFEFLSNRPLQKLSPTAIFYFW